MATYLKRTSKLFDLSVSRGSAEVNLRDLICPVCRGILIEPVTLPCTHNLCLGCLKGTVEHNSLSCPLCRVRVGSWLRTATKSETLVNSALWELIRTRFPKEVEDKHNGDEGDIELDSGFTAEKVILSAAGEIRREYEVQLQMVEERMRRQREAERIANEALIRKIQAEEHQQLAQLAQDELMAKSLAKKQLLNKEKSAMKYYAECKVPSSTNNEQSKVEHRLISVNNVGLTSAHDPSLQVEKNFQNINNLADIQKTNVSIISKIRADRYVGVKMGTSNSYKDCINDKACNQKLLPIHNAVTRTLKHQTIPKYSNPGGSNFAMEPSCSSTQIYGSQSKEELHVPKDVLSSKKKSLGVEVCMTTGEDDERIGSAESAGSHDSINQEIHHFKPIKPMARTALKMSYDGRPIDPKLVRVIPIVKRVSNAVLKPPSPTHVKRILGCSWSAFRGKARQNLELRPTAAAPVSEADATTASTSSSLQPQQLSGKTIKSQVSDTVRRLDLAPDLSFDNNKNYAKNINRILNGTKVSKRLIMDETAEIPKVSKPAKIQANKNGTMTKNKRQRNLWCEKKSEANDDNESPSCSPDTPLAKVVTEGCEDGSTIENIAERIKRRKVNRENATVVESEAEPVQRSTRRRVQAAKPEVEDFDTFEENVTAANTKRKRTVGKTASRTKRQRVTSAGRTDEGSASDKVDSSVESNNETAERRKGKKSARNQGKAAKVKSGGKALQKNAKQNDSEEESSAEDLEKDEGSSTTALPKSTSDEPKVDLDEQIIKEQERMERLILQEKEDFELALRLQAQFNDMERIARRTRGSKRAMESNNVGEVAKTTRINTNSHTANPGSTSQNNHSSKQRRRPQKQAVK